MASGNEEGVRGRQRLGRLALFVVSLLILLALLSYDSRDAAHLAQGLARDAVIHNWIGYFGAYVSRFLLLTLGFGAYPAAALLVLASARRLFGRQGVRTAVWDYWAAIGLVSGGTAMLFGIWPRVGTAFAAHLNIGSLPGGVLGQRFCDPDGGWMRIILNPVGSAIVAVALVAVGIVVIWLYDWHDLCRAAVAARRGRDTAAGNGKSRKRERRPSRLAQRRAERLRRRNTTAEDTGKASPSPPPAPPPAPAPSASRPASKTRKCKIAYVLPGADLLNDAAGPGTTADPKEVAQKRDVLQDTLDSFGIDAQVGDATSGPRVTLFEVLPAPGVKVERISQISNNIAMELRATSLRILTPIPGKKSVGIEVPNTTASTVNLHSLMTTPAWTNSRAAIPLLLGRNISGKVVILDLERAPHLLIAGATGSGKSVCINALIMSMLFRFSPEELRLIMIDPKVVEFRAYEKLPHLVVPVISDVKKVPLALRWVINEMQKRYHLIAKVGARSLSGFNSRSRKGEPELDDDGNVIPERMPHIIVVIDELADIIMTAKADVETSLARIAQLSRAVGIHTIIATQRPSVNVITGTIKANFPTRIAFQVTSQVDSRTILDGKGAEALLGRGDMLFKPPGASRLERNQGAMVDDEELDRVVAHVAAQQEQEFDGNVLRVGAGGEAGGAGAELTDEDEALIQQAVEIIVRDRRATTSYIQRCLRIGYNRAASIIETLEQRGVIGPQIGTAPREILILGSTDGGDGSGSGSDVDDMDSGEEDEAR